MDGLPLAARASLYTACSLSRSSTFRCLNSSRMGPIKSPVVAKAWPPQLSPDSTRYSETHNPRLARNLPWIIAERQSLTFKVIFFLMKPLWSGDKSGNCSSYE